MSMKPAAVVIVLIGDIGLLLNLTLMNVRIFRYLLCLIIGILTGDLMIDFVQGAIAHEYQRLYFTSLPESVLLQC